jgi:hypothetical protein
VAGLAWEKIAAWMWPSLVLATLAVVSQAHLCLFIHALLAIAFVF